MNSDGSNGMKEATHQVNDAVSSESVGVLANRIAAARNRIARMSEPPYALSSIKGSSRKSTSSTATCARTRDSCTILVPASIIAIKREGVLASTRHGEVSTMIDTAAAATMNTRGKNCEENACPVSSRVAAARSRIASMRKDPKPASLAIKSQTGVRESTTSMNVVKIEEGPSIEQESANHLCDTKPDRKHIEVAKSEEASIVNLSEGGEICQGFSKTIDEMVCEANQSTHSVNLPDRRPSDVGPIHLSSNNGESVARGTVAHFTIGEHPSVEGMIRRANPILVKNMNGRGESANLVSEKCEGCLAAAGQLKECGAGDSGNYSDSKRPIEFPEENRQCNDEAAEPFVRLSPTFADGVAADRSSRRQRSSKNAVILSAVGIGALAAAAARKREANKTECGLTDESKSTKAVPQRFDNVCREAAIPSLSLSDGDCRRTTEAAQFSHQSEKETSDNTKSKGADEAHTHSEVSAGSLGGEALNSGAFRPRIDLAPPFALRGTAAAAAADRKQENCLPVPLEGAEASVAFARRDASITKEDATSLDGIGIEADDTSSPLPSVGVLRVNNSGDKAAPQPSNVSKSAVEGITMMDAEPEENKLEDCYTVPPEDIGALSVVTSRGRNTSNVKEDAASPPSPSQGGCSLVTAAAAAACSQKLPSEAVVRKNSDNKTRPRFHRDPPFDAGESAAAASAAAKFSNRRQGCRFPCPVDGTLALAATADGICVAPTEKEGAAPSRAPSTSEAGAAATATWARSRNLESSEAVDRENADKNTTPRLHNAPPPIFPGGVAAAAAAAAAAAKRDNGKQESCALMPVERIGAPAATPARNCETSNTMERATPSAPSLLGEGGNAAGSTAARPRKLSTKAIDSDKADEKTLPRRQNAARFGRNGIAAAAAAAAAAKTFLNGKQTNYSIMPVGGIGALAAAAATAARKLDSSNVTENSEAPPSPLHARNRIAPPAAAAADSRNFLAGMVDKRNGDENTQPQIRHGAGGITTAAAAAVAKRYEGEQKTPALTYMEGISSRAADLGRNLGTQCYHGNKENNVPTLREEPDYSKYFNMLKMGLPEGAVRNALQRDGKDPGVLDLNPDKSLKSQKGEAASGPPLKDDPEYAKYFKMLKMGLPDGAVRNALQRDGKDPGILDLDPNQPLKSQIGEGNKTDNGPPLRADPEYSKYYRMLKMGLSEGAVRNALERDGKDPRIMDLDPEKSLKSQMGAEANEDDGPPIKDDPEFSKYFKMLKMMLPMGAVKQAMQRDGKDPSIMDLDHSMSLKSQNAAKDEGPPLKDDPEFSKYFKMLKMGLPMGAVKNALQRDGKDTALMDLDPSKSVASQMSSGKRRKLSKKAKKAVRRKKIYWTPIDPVKVHQDSIWSLVRGTVNMDELKYDATEFENLFTESSDPAEKKKKSRSAGEQSMKPKKSIQVIDGKRGMNGGIILARLKIEYEKLADMVDRMESDKLDATQLRALKEFLPTDEERSALRQYMKKGEASEQALVEAKAALSESEKYMVTMMKVKNADAKFDCMLFKSQFDSRLDELIVARDTVKKACDEVRSSERLRKIFAMILTLVNQINTGGCGNMAVGFSLDALLKLNEAKAFDKKTSVLQYLAKLVRQNDEQLLTFKDDISSVTSADNIVLDSLAMDIKTLNEELGKVHQTAKEEADVLMAEKVPIKLTIDELCSQKTEVRNVDGLVHFNKIDHITGRTPMERFTIRSGNLIEKVVASVEDLQHDYSDLLNYFGEDEKMPSNEFFGTIYKFVVEFDAAVRHVEKAEKNKVKEKLRAASKVMSLAKRISPAKKCKGTIRSSASLAPGALTLGV